MEIVVDYVALKGAHGEVVVKELSIASDCIIQAYHFISPYSMDPITREKNKTSDNGLHWDDGHIQYSQFSTVLDEAVAGFPHLYS